MMKSAFYLALVPSTVAFFAVASARDEARQQMILSIKFYETAADGSTERVMAEPTVVSDFNTPFSLRSGGIVKPKTGGGQWEIGTQVSGRLAKPRADAVRLALELRFNSTVSPEDDPHSELLRTESLDIRTVLRLGQTKRLACSASQWCELRVDLIE